MDQARVFGVVPREQATTQSGLDFMRDVHSGALPSPPFAQASDIWPVTIERGHIVFEGAPSSRFYNPMGTVHGGWLATLLDTVMGCAVHTTLAPGQFYTTLEMKIVYVKAVFEKTGTLRAEGTLLHAGSRVASAEGKIYDAAGTLIAHGSETCLITQLQT